MKDHKYIPAVISNGKIVPSTPYYKELLKEFVEENEGASIRMYIELQGKEKSLAQLAKVHAMIREISAYTGQSTEDIKAEIKRRAGFVTDPAVSMKDMDVQELNSIIQETYNLGDFLGINLY